MNVPKRSIENEFEEDPRYRISLKEAWWSVGYWAAYSGAVIFVAWGMAGGRDPEETTYVLGFPDWFFWSCLVVPAVFCTIVPVLLIKFAFTDVSLEEDDVA